MYHKNWWNNNRWCWKVRFIHTNAQFNRISSSNYSETLGSLWFYSKDDAADFNNNIENTNDFKSFMYKAKLLGNIFAQPNPNHANGLLTIATIVVPSKYI